MQRTDSASEMTLEDQRAQLMGMRGVFPDLAQQQHYLSIGWSRMQIVLGILDRLQKEGVHRVLELGANPYFMTLQMKWRFGFELELANFFGDQHAADQQTHVLEVGGRRMELPFRHFNIERDPFPYPPASFDCVLFCEILEHLLIAPDHAAAEIARIVRPGGYVIVSTPNATRLTNLYFLALGHSIWEWYSPNGPYGRHNREFTLTEVRNLLQRNGFDMAHAEVKNIQRLARRFTFIQWLRPTVWNEHLFVVGRRRG